MIRCIECHKSDSMWMSATPNPHHAPVTESPSTPPTLQPAPRKKIPPLVIGLTGAAIVILVLAGVLLTNTLKPTAKAQPSPSLVWPVSSTRPKPNYYQPEVADFELRVKILEKSCFGSAGCLISYRVELEYNGDGTFDPAVTYEITYEVKGGTDQQINTIDLTGTSYGTEKSRSIRTKSSKDELTAVVVSISKR